MSPNLVQGDQVSCSRVGGAMRRESARLRQRAQALDDALADLAAQSDPDRAGTTIMAVSAVPAPQGAMAAMRAMRAIARDLDDAGTVLQRYATDLAEGHELGRRAELRVQGAGLLLDGARVIEPWGLASAQDATRRRSEVPQVQARVDLATAHVGRARGRLERDATRLTEDFAAASLEARSALEPRLAGRARLPRR